MEQKIKELETHQEGRKGVLYTWVKQYAGTGTQTSQIYAYRANLKEGVLLMSYSGKYVRPNDDGTDRETTREGADV